MARGDEGQGGQGATRFAGAHHDHKRTDACPRVEAHKVKQVVKHGAVVADAKLHKLLGKGAHVVGGDRGKKVNVLWGVKLFQLATVGKSRAL